jgi:hypothetical protein
MNISPIELNASGKLAAGRLLYWEVASLDLSGSGVWRAAVRELNQEAVDFILGRRSRPEAVDEPRHREGRNLIEISLKYGMVVDLPVTSLCRIMRRLTDDRKLDLFDPLRPGAI